MKRQRGRNRGGGGGSGGGGGKPQQHNANRAFDSNGPEGVKVRGNPQHVFEKYQQLARDANAAGDRVLGENYLQHAEHYFRLLRALQPSRPASEIIGRDQFTSGYDIDFEDESGQAQAIAADEAAAAAESAEPREDEPRDQNRSRDRGEWQARDDRPRDDRNRDDRPRDERPRDDRPRDDRPRDDRPRDDRPRADGPNREGGGRDRWRERDDRNRDGRNRNRDDRPREDRPRAEGEDRPREDRPQRQDRPERDPLPVVQPQARELAPEGPMLRDSDGGESHAPAFLQAARAPAPAVEASEDAPKRAPRRRKPRTFEAGEGGTPETEEA